MTSVPVSASITFKNGFRLVFNNQNWFRCHSTLSYLPVAALIEQYDNSASMAPGQAAIRA